MINITMLNGWILKDELPIPYATILLWVKDGCTVGYYDNSRKVWYDVFDKQLFDVVAWQPMPFGPNGEALVKEFK